MKPMHPLRGESAANHPSLAALATVSDASDGLPVVCNLFDWLQSAFVKTDYY